MPLGKPRFHYYNIGDKLAEELCHLVTRGESFVILGPRGAGKRYLLELLMVEWRRTSRAHYYAPLGKSEVVVSEAEVASLLAQHCQISEPIETFDDWRQAIRENALANGAPITVIASNVDGLSKELARKFLTTVRVLVQEGSLTVGLTGESNLVDLVYGPNSAFACADQFVVHAHDEKHFLRFLKKRLRSMRFRWPVEDKVSRSLLEKILGLTGGDIALARAAIWCASERQVFHLNEPTIEQLEHELKAEELPSNLLTEHLIPMSGLVPFRYAVRCIESDPTAWTDLETLLNSAPLFAADSKPTTLELAGLVRRNERTRELTWTGGYARSFAEFYFVPWRLGDLYASIGNWDEAFKRYSRPRNSEETRRPLSQDDVLVLNRTVDALGGEFSKLAAFEDPDFASPTLEKLFTNACQHLLGFGEVTFWTFSSGKWQPKNALRGVSQPPKSILVEWGTPGNSGRTDVTGGTLWVLSRCTEKKSPPRQAVTVDLGEASETLAPSRLGAAKRIITAYQSAYEHAQLVSTLKRDSESREKILSITKQLLHEVGGGDWRLCETLLFSCNKLLEVDGIVRAVFMLRTKDSQQIDYLQVALDSQSPGRIPATEVQHSFRNQHVKSLSSMVSSNTPQIHSTNDAPVINALLTTPVTNPFLLLQLGECQGILAVEVKSAETLNQNLLDTLKVFAQRLGAIVNIVHKFDLLQDCLDEMRNPTLVIDTSGRASFFNKPADEKLELNREVVGWQSPPLNLPDANSNPSLNKHIKEAMQKQFSVHRSDDLTEMMPGTWLTSSMPLMGWNGQPAGWFLYFRDRAFLFKTFEMMRDIETAASVDEALRTVSNCLQDYAWGVETELRVYKIDPSDPNMLVSLFATGLNDENSRAFETQRIQMSRTQHQQGWRALEERTPVVFCWRPGEPKGPQRTTAGLRYQSVTTTNFVAELEKEPGDLWIDIPLFQADKPLGKFTLSFSKEASQTLIPETRELLQGLSFVIGDLVERVERDQNQKYERERSAEYALGQTAHNLVAKIAALTCLLARYRLLENKLQGKEASKLNQINNEFEAFYQQAIHSLVRIKDRLGPIKLNPGETAVGFEEIVTTGLNQVLYDLENNKDINARPKTNWDWIGSPLPLQARWDGVHWENVFIEMAHNSLAFEDPGRALHVTVETCLETSQEGERTLVLTYRDNGRGVLDEHKKNIFESFVTHRETIESKGQGIGLNYVARVVRAEGGTIEETGVFGEGATFTIRLPISALVERYHLEINDHPQHRK